MDSRSKNILNGILSNKRIANSYLFTGGSDDAKNASAIYFAEALNCLESPAPCGNCSSCKRSNKSVNPDIITIEKDGASIKIEQIRSLKELTKYGPSKFKWQVVIIKNIDTITNEAANSFLKLLEEPPKNVIFILINGREGNLPKTIESRCQKIIFEETGTADPQESSEALYKQIESGKFDYIDMSQMILETKDSKKLLQDFFTLYAMNKKINQARTVLETLKGLERKANPKIALDLLSYKLWKKN